VFSERVVTALIQQVMVRLASALVLQEIVMSSDGLATAVTVERLLGGVRLFVTQERAVVLHLGSARPARVQRYLRNCIAAVVQRLRLPEQFLLLAAAADTATATAIL